MLFIVDNDGHAKYAFNVFHISLLKLEGDELLIYTLNGTLTRLHGKTQEDLDLYLERIQIQKAEAFKFPRKNVC